MYLGGIISRKEFDAVIDKSSKITAKVYSENRKADVEGIPSGIVATLAITTLLLVSYFFLLYYGIRDDNRKLKIAGFFLLAISVFVTANIGIRNFFQKPGRYTPFVPAVRKALDTFFDRENKKYVL